MRVLSDKRGYPAAAFCGSAFVSTVNMSQRAKSDRNLLAPFPRDKRVIKYDKYEIVPWGRDNDFPYRATAVVRTTSVLNTGLKFLRQLTIGQGLYPCQVDGFDVDGNEVLSPVADKGLAKLVNGRMARKYMENISRDYFKLGTAFVLLVPNEFGQIVGLQSVNAKYVRLTKPDESGLRKAIVSGDWPAAPDLMGGNAQVYDCLMDYDPELHLELLKASGRMNKPVMYCVHDTWSNDDVYGEPVWLSAYILGWIDIAHIVPAFLRKAYENQVTFKWHIKIPYAYWERRYPEDDPRYNTPKKREAAIQQEMDEIEQELCGVDSAEKPLFTHFNLNDSGRAEEKWEIEALDNKYKGGENLVTSAAANSEILFALMVNPNVFGAGMPGGSYAGNQGGSNIREAFLVNIALAWIDRQTFLDPLMILLKELGYDDVQVRYRNTVLVTLNTGAGTQKTLS